MNIAVNTYNDFTQHRRTPWKSLDALQREKRYLRALVAYRNGILKTPPDAFADFARNSGLSINTNARLSCRNAVQSECRRSRSLAPLRAPKYCFCYPRTARCTCGKSPGCAAQTLRVRFAPSSVCKRPASWPSVTTVGESSRSTAPIVPSRAFKHFCLNLRASFHRHASTFRATAMACRSLSRWRNARRLCHL